MTAAKIGATAPLFTTPVGYTDSSGNLQTATSSAGLPVTGTFSNPSTGTNGSIAPTSSTEIGGINPSGNLAAINTLSAGTNQNGLLVAIGATNFVASTNNSSTAQLTAGATFTGVIESVFNEPGISVLLTTDQNGTLTINQYIDAGGVHLAGTIVIAVTANVPIARSYIINANYLNVTFHNTGGSTTTTFDLNIAYGTITPATQLVNNPSAINEINGTAVSTAASGTMLVGVADGSGNKITSTLNSGKQSLDVNLSGATNITTGPAVTPLSGSITLTGAANGYIFNVSAFTCVTVKVTAPAAGCVINFTSSTLLSGTPADTLLVTKAGSGVPISTDTLGANATQIYQFNVIGQLQVNISAGTLSAGTITIIGNITTDSVALNQFVQALIQDSAGNGLTSNSTTYTAKHALDGNLLGTLGTAFTTAGFVDIKGADGNVFVRQATAGNLNATVVGQATGSAVPATAFYDSVLAQTALPAAASAGNLTGTLGDKFGRKVIMPYGMRDIIGMSTTTITSTTGATSIIAAIASTFTDIVCLILSNSSASATDTTLSDGTNSYHIYVPAGDCRGFSTGVILPATTVNTAWTVACGTSVASLFVTAIYVKDK